MTQEQKQIACDIDKLSYIKDNKGIINLKLITTCSKGSMPFNDCIPVYNITDIKLKEKLCRAIQIDIDVIVEELKKNLKKLSGSSSI